MKDFFSGLLVFFFYGALVILFVLGIIHSSKKHNDVIVDIAFFPWGIYRGAESFWHDDYSDVNWSEKLHTDYQICVLYLANANSISSPSLIREYADFKKEIKNYPADKRDSLKLCLKTYIKYIFSLQTDIINSYKIYRQNRKMPLHLIENEETTRLTKALSRYISLDELDLGKDGINKIFAENARQNVDDNELDSRIIQQEQNIDLLFKRNQSSYGDLIGEKY